MPIVKPIDAALVGFEIDAVHYFLRFVSLQQLSLVRRLRVALFEDLAFSFDP